DRAHRPLRLDEARLVDPVLELLAPDRLPDHSLELGVRDSAADRPAKIGLGEREQAGAKLAIRGEPYPVAVRAEWLGDGVDEADLPAAVGESEDAGRRGRLPLSLDEPVTSLDRQADLLA